MNKTKESLLIENKLLFSEAACFLETFSYFFFLNQLSLHDINEKFLSQIWDAKEMIIQQSSMSQLQQTLMKSGNQTLQNLRFNSSIVLQ